MSKRSLSVRKKNEKRKKYGFFPVRLPVRLPLVEGLTVLKVSVPLIISSFEVSIPLSSFLESTVSSTTALVRRLDAARILPKGKEHMA